MRDDTAQAYAEGGYISGPASVHLPPEPEQIQRLRRAVSGYDEEVGWLPFGAVPHDMVPELADAARDLLAAVDEERARMLTMMQTELHQRQADFLRQINDCQPEPRVLSADEVAALGADQLAKLREMTGRAAVAYPDHPSAQEWTCACRGRHPAQGWWHSYATSLEPKP